VLQTDETDFAWNLLIEPDILNELAAGGNAELVTVLGSTERIMINFTDPNVEVDGARSELPTEHPLFQHPEVRQALALAIQRDVISEQIFGPLGGVATAYVLNYPEKYKPEGITWEYDLDQARALLESAGFPDAFESTALLYQTTVNSQRQKIQETVKQDLEQLGFSVELKSIDASVFLSSDAGNPDTYAHFYADIEMYANQSSSPYPIAWAARYRSDQVAQQANQWSGANITRYQNPEFDALHDLAQSEMDEVTQIELFQGMLQMVHDDVVEIPITSKFFTSGISNRIKNHSLKSPWAPTPGYDIKNWTL
jgi:peptide/nickel transport system substrate-binding protein